MPTTIQDFADKVEALFTTIGEDVDSAVSSLTGINGDVQSLKKQIADLQASAGTVTPEDQARIDKIEATVNGLAAKTAAAKEVAAKLDAETETAPTPEPS